MPVKKGAILFMHGILDSSDGWLANKDQSPAIIAAKEGFDVWLGNQRGNKYSRDHLTKSPDDLQPEIEKGEKTFWDFSFQEIGLHDIPAMITYIC